MKSSKKIDPFADRLIKAYMNRDKKPYTLKQKQFLRLKYTIQMNREKEDISYLSIYKSLRDGGVIEYSYSTFMRLVNRYIEIDKKTDTTIEKEQKEIMEGETQSFESTLSKVFKMRTDIEGLI